MKINNGKIDLSRPFYLAFLLIIMIPGCTYSKSSSQDFYLYRYPDETSDVYAVLAHNSKFSLYFQLQDWCFIRVSTDEIHGFSLCSEIGVPNVNTSINDFHVIIDAGHGGIDNGAMYFGVAEKDINMQIATKVANKLKESGIQTIMTRKGDETLRLYTRPSYANLIALSDLYLKSDEETKKSMQPYLMMLQEIVIENPVVTPDVYLKEKDTNMISDELTTIMKWLHGNTSVIFLSIHANSTQDQSLGYRGTELITATGNIEHDYPGYAWYDTETRMSLVYSLKDALRSVNVLPWRKSYLGDYVVLRETNIPSILLELGYLNHRRDNEILQNEESQKRLADAIISGVIHWYHSQSLE